MSYEFLKFMSFFWFYLIFYLIFIKYFSLLKSQKREYLTCRWWHGERTKVASWRGAQDHCADATRHWGHVVGPRVAHARCRRHTGREHVAGGHACPRRSTRRPVRGATWHVGWHMEGPQVIGPCLGVWGGNANVLPRPYFSAKLSPCFLPCGTMFPHVFLFCRLRGDTTSVGCSQDGGDRVDPSPRDHQIKHVRGIWVKWWWSMLQMLTRGGDRDVRS